MPKGDEHLEIWGEAKHKWPFGKFRWSQIIHLINIYEASSEYKAQKDEFLKKLSLKGF